MGKTRRRNPIARELAKPQYRGRKMKDKRVKQLEQLEDDTTNVICFYCGNLMVICKCPEQEHKAK